jgi:triacylglycerol lipase
VHAPSEPITQIWAENNLTSYSYRFDVVPNGVSYSFGADHLQEVAFVRNNVEGAGYVQKRGQGPFADKLDNFTDLARMMARMWSSFFLWVGSKLFWRYVVKWNGIGAEAMNGVEEEV